MHQLSPQFITRVLASLPRPRRYLVAYSGGPDSQALLEVLVAARLNVEVDAIHVDHGLHPDSPQWSRLCRARCEALGISLHCESLKVEPLKGESPEACARRCRYAAIQGRLQPSDMVLTAHTEDDQAETLLLQLLRGAGVDGLAAMPMLRRLGGGWHARPMLGLSRAAVRDYVAERGLTVLEDPSNRDLRFDRNYLRHEVLPALTRRWPAAGKVLARAAAHQAEAMGLLGSLAEQDLRARAVPSPDGSLPVDILTGIEPARRRNLLRFWVKRRGFDPPPARILGRVESELLAARADRNPVLRWGRAELRRFQGRLHLMTPLRSHQHGPLLWRLCEAAPPVHGELRATAVLGSGLAAASCPEGRVEIRFRQGGERCRPDGRHHAQTLKRLLQEARVAPWLRGRLPLLYVGGELAVVAGLWVCAAFAARPGEPGWHIQWTDEATPRPVEEFTGPSR